MTRKTITSANAVILMTIPMLPIPVELKQFSSDDMINMDEIVLSESRMGVDGIKSSGYVPSIKTVHITFEANSPSIDIFNIWVNAMIVAREVFETTAFTVSLPGLKKTFLFTNGSLKNAKLLPDLKKTAQPVTYTLEFESITSVPFA